MCLQCNATAHYMRWTTNPSHRHIVHHWLSDCYINWKLKFIDQDVGYGQKYWYASPLHNFPDIPFKIYRHIYNSSEKDFHTILPMEFFSPFIIKSIFETDLLMLDQRAQKGWGQGSVEASQILPHQTSTSLGVLGSWLGEWIHTGVVMSLNESNKWM